MTATRQDTDLCPPVLCVDIGGTSTKVAVVQSEGEVRFLKSIPTKPSPEAYVEQLIELIAKICAQSQDQTGHAPHQFGVAVAGFLDGGRNHLLYNSNLAWLEGFPLRQHLSTHFTDIEIELEVDSNAATMAEYQLGSGRGSRRFLCLAAGTGLGVGMAIDGKPLRFAHGCLGDIGHIIVLRDGPLCTCGGRGCAEIMVSAPVLAQQYQANKPKPGGVTLRDVIADAHAGEPAAITVLGQAGEWLGLATASLSNIFFPDHIAIAGGLSAAKDFVLRPAERVFRESACVLAREGATLTLATLGSMATLIGAAWPFWQAKDA
jgi:glucokinase